MSDDRRPSFPKVENGGLDPRGRAPSTGGLELPDGALELAPLEEEEDLAPIARVTRPSLGGEGPGPLAPSGTPAGGPPSFRDAAPLELDHARGPARGGGAGASLSTAEGPEREMRAAGPASSLPSGGSGAARVEHPAELARAWSPSGTPEGDEAQAGRRRLLLLGGALAGVAALAGLYFGMGWNKDKPPARRKRRGEDDGDDGDDSPERPARRPALPRDLPVQEVQIVFEVTPREAVLLVRGREAIGHSLLMPLGDQPIEVRFEAKGHAPEVVRVVPDQNRTVTVHLTPRS